VEVAALARMALTDAVLILWTTAAGFAFFRAHHGPPPRGRWYVAMYAAIALGTLTKGPVGILVPVVAIGTYLALAGGARRALREARPVWGLALLLAIAGPWYAAILWEHGPAYVVRARGETLGRVFRTVTGPGGTVLFYLPVVLVGFFPWSAFLPGALVTVLRGARARATANRTGATLVFAAASVVSVLVAFSLFQSRLPHYVAPLFPAAALLVAATWPSRVPVTARGLLAGLGLLLGGALVGAWAWGPTVVRLLARAYPSAPGTRLPLAVALVGGLVLVIATTARLRDGARLFQALGLFTTLLFGLGLHVGLPAVDAAFVASPSRLVARIAPTMRPCDEIVAFGPYRPSLLFYARRPVTFVDARDPARSTALRAPAGRLFVLAPTAIEDQLPPAAAQLARLDADGGYVILASPASDGPCVRP